MPTMMECPCCEGAGCKECSRGMIQITGCPQRLITANGSRVIAALGLCEEGHLPASGGVMDQTPWFIRCRAIYRRHESAWSEWARKRQAGGR